MRMRLGNGKYTHIDEEDYAWASKHTWSYHFAGYVARQGPRPGRKKISLHRVIMKAKKGQHVDHINGKPWDNRRENLRFVTRSQQCFNSSKKRGTRTKFKGVTYHKQRGKWWARIHKHGKQISLGLFDTATGASKAYKIAAIKLYGEYACITNKRRNVWRPMQKRSQLK